MFNVAGKSPLLGVDVATRTRVSRIIGKPALQAVEIENLDTGDRRIIDCDTLVLTGDWIPDHELARSAGLDMDPKTLGPLVDTALRTSTTRRLRHRQPAAPGRHRRHRRPRRPTRRRTRSGISARTGRTIRRCPHPRRTAAALDLARDSAARTTSHRPAIGCCCGPTPWCASPGSWYARTATSSPERHCRGPPHQDEYFECHQAFSTR